MDAISASIRVISEKFHPEVPSESEYPVIATIMQNCFNFQAENRPTFKTICSELSNVKVVDNKFCTK